MHGKSRPDVAKRAGPASGGQREAACLLVSPCPAPSLLPLDHQPTQGPVACPPPRSSPYTVSRQLSLTPFQNPLPPCSLPPSGLSAPGPPPLLLVFARSRRRLLGPSLSTGLSSGRTASTSCRPSPRAPSRARPRWPDRLRSASSLSLSCPHSPARPGRRSGERANPSAALSLPFIRPPLAPSLCDDRPPGTHVDPSYNDLRLAKLSAQELLAESDSRVDRKMRHFTGSSLPSFLLLLNFIPPLPGKR